MGHSRASKAETHAKLVERAAARFKERGVDGISLAELMKELRLTHGGFYRHFGSRDELVGEAVQRALEDSSVTMKGWLYQDGEPRLQRFIDRYLDETLKDRRAEGCTVAALAGDAARSSPGLRRKFSDHIEGNLAALENAFQETGRSSRRGGAAAGRRRRGAPASRGRGASGAAEDARSEAIVLLCALYGALTVARAVGDAPLAAEVLKTLRRRALGASTARAARSRVTPSKR